MNMIPDGSTATVGNQVGRLSSPDIYERGNSLKERDGYAVMAAVSAFDQAIHRGALTRAAHVAQLFCIFCAFVAPVVIVWARST